MHRHITTISYLLAVTVVLLVLRFHLLPAVFAGLAVYVLTLKLARHLPKNMNRVAHQVALGVVVTCVIACLTSTGAAIWSFIGRFLIDSAACHLPRKRTKTQVLFKSAMVPIFHLCKHCHDHCL